MKVVSDFTVLIGLAKIEKTDLLRDIFQKICIPEAVFRKQNMGISAGHVNALDYCSTMLGFPTLFELEEMTW